MSQGKPFAPGKGTMSNQMPREAPLKLKRKIVQKYILEQVSKEHQSTPLNLKTHCSFFTFLT